VRFDVLNNLAFIVMNSELKRVRTSVYNFDRFSFHVDLSTLVLLKYIEVDLMGYCFYGVNSFKMGL